jgi:hypothetical protein
LTEDAVLVHRFLRADDPFESKTHPPKKLFDNLELDSLLMEILGRMAAGACHLMRFRAA